MHVEYRCGYCADGGILIAEGLDFVENVSRSGSAARLEAAFNDFAELLFAYRDVRAEEIVRNFVLEVVFLILPYNKAEVLRHFVVEYNSADGSLYLARYGFAVERRLFVVYGYSPADVNFVLHVDKLGLVSHERFVFGDVSAGHVLLSALFAFGAFNVSVAAPAVELAFFAPYYGKVISTHNHILRRLHNGLAVGKL